MWRVYREITFTVLVSSRPKWYVNALGAEAVALFVHDKIQGFSVDKILEIRQGDFVSLTHLPRSIRP